MRGVLNFLGFLVIIASLAACAPWQPAPVEDRRDSAGSAPSQTGSGPARQRAGGPVPPFHEVGRGDTLYSIAFRYGLDWRSVAEWNRIQPPYTIRPGQELRLSAPPNAVASSPPQPPTQASPRPEPAPPAQAPRSSAPAPAPAPSPRPAPPSSSTPSPAAASTASRTVAGVSWRWPTNGNVQRRFDPAATRRGIGIAGEVGQLVLAAADGEVVYSGTALIGYGELIIIKHSDTMLSAYGHNRRRLVSEGDRVRAGQPIAEMGMDESQRALLHFEVRRNGQPEDPMAFLPPR
ncbi:MAG: peptidoglycan DD-metalloendopeptidase family protein [Wenzhouxiangella sp.]